MEPKRYKLRTTALLAAGTLLFGVAAVSVQAYEPCQRIVERYVEKVVPHHYSQATLARWAVWGKKHPNYHPPKAQPKLQPQETMAKLNFDCEVQPDPVMVSGLLAPSALPDLAPSPLLVTVATAPPPAGPTISLVNVPLDVPPTSTGDVPESKTWIYVLTGAVFLWFRLRQRFSEGFPKTSAA